MKANELMIGDWVLINGTPRKIQAVDGFDDEIMADDDLYTLAKDRYHSEDRVEGVPLTPEILEKNGWKNSAPGVWQKEYGGFVFYWEEGTERFGMDDFRHLQEQWKIHLQIKHIHQLQHALRLCGIKKEIEL